MPSPSHSRFYHPHKFIESTIISISNLHMLIIVLSGAVRCETTK